jgi:hypothetical protein
MRFLKVEMDSGCALRLSGIPASAVLFMVVIPHYHHVDAKARLSSAVEVSCNGQHVQD